MARCRGCGYFLRGLDSHRCPECGREFDPANPDTMKLPRKWRWPLQRVRKTFWGEMVKLAALSMLILSFSPVSHHYPQHWIRPIDVVLQMFGIFLWLCFFVACLIRIILRGQKRIARSTADPMYSWLLPVLCVFIVALSITSAFRIGHCPHADYFLIDGVGLARGPRGDWAPHGKNHIYGDWYFMFEPPIRRMDW